MASYTISIEGGESFDCADDVYLLDAAEAAGVDLPSSCRAGACLACASIILTGSVDRIVQSFRDEDQVERGYALLCVSYPVSNCTIKSDIQNDLN